MLNKESPFPVKGWVFHFLLELSLILSAPSLYMVIFMLPLLYLNGSLFCYQHIHMVSFSVLLCLCVCFVVLLTQYSTSVLFLQNSKDLFTRVLLLSKISFMGTAYYVIQEWRLCHFSYCSRTLGRKPPHSLFEHFFVLVSYDHSFLNCFLLYLRFLTMVERVLKVVIFYKQIGDFCNCYQKYSTKWWKQRQRSTDKHFAELQVSCGRKGWGILPARGVMMGKPRDSRSELVGNHGCLINSQEACVGPT